VSEVVTCNFGGATTSQSCWSSYGSCSGVGSCQVKLSGPSGTLLSWGSSCGAMAMNTVLDGVSETVYFKCATPVISETVTCSFGSGTTAQECIPSKGVGCKGIGKCSVTVSGTLGETVSWKSTCGGSATTIVDGKNETIAFPCGGPAVSETVTCLFQGSNTYHTCTSSKGSCTGLLGCTLVVSGAAGEVVNWKSTCGGYVSTIVDGKDEQALFYCGSVVVDGGLPPPWPDGGWWP